MGYKIGAPAPVLSWLKAEIMSELQRGNAATFRCDKKAADLIFSNLFAVRCVRIQRGRDGYTMLRFPFRVAEDLLGCQKRLLDVCHPLTGKFRQELTELVKQEWEQKFGQEIESETQS